MSPIEILVLAFIGAVLVGRLRSPIVRGPVLGARPRGPVRSPRAAQSPRLHGSAGRPAPRAA